MKKLINLWHSHLNMSKYDLDWHKKDMADEIEEFEEEKGMINKWSELSDVAYTYTRAKWSGHTEIEFPFKKIFMYVGFIYMIPKYTLRWKFFRVLGRRFDKNLKITEVRNPKKLEKLENIAKRYDLDSIKFQNEAKKLMGKWLFLK